MRPVGPGARWPTALALVGLVLLAAGVARVLVVWADAGAAAADSEASLLGAVLTAAGVAVTVVGWAVRRRAAATRPVTPEQVAQAAATLAELVREQWTSEAQVRALGDPEPMPVRWRLTTPDLMDHADLVDPAGPVSFAGRSDRIGAVADAFRALPRRRLVITGGPGTGKTTLAVQLVLALLPPPQVAPTEPVPVLVSLVGWDPAAQPRVQEWLAAQLDQTYPALRAVAPGAAAALVAHDRVLPVLDGLDEIAEGRRPMVVKALNASLLSGLVLTSRRPEYRAAVTAAGDVVTAAATIGPLALTPAEAAAYLRRHLPPRSGPGWAVVLDALAAGAAPALAALTATPYGLWLVRAVYVDGRRDPGDLLDPVRPTGAALRRHVVSQLITAAVESRPPIARRRAADPDTPFRPSRAHSPADLRRWLTTLAEQMRDAGTRDWRWWELPTRVFPSRATRIAAGLAVGLTILVLACVATPLVSSQFVAGRDRAEVLAAHLVIGVTLGLPAAVIIGIAAARSCGRTPLPRQADLRTRPRALLYAVLGGAVRGAVVTALAAALFLVVFAPREPAPASQVALTLAEVIGALAGFIGAPVGATFGALRVVVRVDLGQGASSPTASHRADRVVAGATMLAGVVAYAPVFGVSFAVGLRQGVVQPDELVAVVAVAVLVLGPIGVALALRRHPSPAVALATAWSVVRGRLPWRLMPVLDDAHRLGLLRAVGPVYQFRHADLQDFLAPPATGAAPVSVSPRDPAATA